MLDQRIEENRPKEERQLSVSNRAKIMRGKWKGIACTLAAVVLAAVAWATYWHQTSGPARSIACIGRLKAVGETAFRWAATHDGQTPPSLKYLHDTAALEPKAFICPESGSEPVRGRFVCDYNSVFDRAGRSVGVRDVGDLSAAMLVWDSKPNHRHGDERYRHAFFMDGTVRRLSGPEFKKALAVLDELFPPKEKSGEEGSD